VEISNNLRLIGNFTITKITITYWQMLHPFIAFLIGSIVLFSCRVQEPVVINKVIGNAGIEFYYGDTPADEIRETEKITAHLKYTHLMLLQRTLHLKDAAVRAKRLTLLGHLNKYIKRGVFPVNSAYNERKPCFIDEYGSYCAVGYLIQQTVGSELPEKINCLFQYEYLAAMQLKELNEWVAQSGFTLEELATIQPTYGTYILKYSVAAGAGMSYRGIALGYPSFQLDYGKHLKYNFHSISSRVEMMGPDNFYTSVSYRKGFELGGKIKYIRSRTLGFLLGPGMLYKNKEVAWLLKPGMQINLWTGHVKQFGIGLLLGYAYDIPVYNSNLFTLSRHDLSLHLMIGTSKMGITYRDLDRKKYNNRQSD
jgi:hypothetical protein